MKTPNEWRKEATFDMAAWSKDQFLMFIEAIQNDAIKSTIGKATNNTELEPGQKWQCNETGAIYTTTQIKHFYVSLARDGTLLSKCCVIPYFIDTHTQIQS